jgi:hypothetical protein
MCLDTAWALVPLAVGVALYAIEPAGKYTAIYTAGTLIFGIISEIVAAEERANLTLLFFCHPTPHQI